MGEAGERADRGAVGPGQHALEATLDLLEVGCGEVEVAQHPGTELDHGAVDPVAVGVAGVGLLDPQGDVDLVQPPAVADGRVEVGQLGGGDEQVALADGELDRVAGEPLGTVAQEHAGFGLGVEVVTIGHHTGPFVGQLDAARGAEPEGPRLGLDPLVALGPLGRLGPEALAPERVEEHVAGGRQCPREQVGVVARERALEHAAVGRLEVVATTRELVGAGVADAAVAGLLDGAVGPQVAPFEGGERRHHLERRAGGVGALDGPVHDGREALGRREQLELGERDAVHELRRVVRRVARHGEQGPVAGIEGDGGTGRADDGGIAGLGPPGPRRGEAVGQLLFDRGLEIDVDREVEVGSRHGIATELDPLADDLAAVVDLEVADPGDPPQDVLEDALHAGLPDLVAQLVELRIGGVAVDAFVGHLELVERDRADIAEQVRGQAAERIAAHGARDHLDTGELIGPFAHEDEEVGVDVDRDGNHVEGPVLLAVHLAADRVDLRQPPRPADRHRQAVEHRLAFVVGQVLDHRLVDRDHVDDGVVDQHPPVAVEDPAPRRLLEDLAQHVGLRLVGQHLVLDALEVPETGEERAEQDERHEGEDPESQPAGVVVHGHEISTPS